MSEDTLLDSFDASKKKRKKKKLPFDLDAALSETASPAASDPATGAVSSSSAAAAVAASSSAAASAGSDESASQSGPSSASESVVKGECIDLSLETLGKKKKKKKALNLDELNENLPTISENRAVSASATADHPTTTATSSATATNNTDVPAHNDQAAEMDMDLSMDFALGKKKKRKKKDIEELMADGADKENEADDMAGVPVWLSSERDYTYDELLTRVFDIMRERNPDMVAGEKRKFVMRPPQVVRLGAKKTSFVNFPDICKMLHRQPQHLLAFLFAELGTSGSVDGTNQLIIKGRFQQKQIETVLRRYIKEYVTCHTCRSADTILQKDTRLFFLQCESCGSRCTVASIKSGFQAVTGKRSALRAKAS